MIKPIRIEKISAAPDVYRVEDTKSSVALTFEAGAYNTKQKVDTSRATISSASEAATEIAAGLRRIGDFVAYFFPELVPAEGEGLRANLVKAAAFPDTVAGPIDYTLIAKAYKYYVFAGRDTEDTDKATRERVGAARTGADIVAAFRKVVPDIVDSITPEEVAAYLVEYREALAKICK